MVDNYKNKTASMGLPDKMSAGHRLRAPEMNAIMDGVRANANILFEHGFYDRPNLPRKVRGLNTFGAQINAWQLVEITGVAVDDPLVVNFTRPTGTGISLIGVTSNQVAANRVVYIYIYGEAFVEYAGVVNTGDRLGTQTDSTVAAADATGPLLVFDTTTIDAVNYALCLFSEGGAGNELITVNLPATDIDAGDWVDLANFRVPGGKKMYILKAVITDYAGSANAGYDLEAYNVTDAVSMYETSNGTIQEGTMASPLNAVEQAEGDQVVIRAENNSVGDNYLCAIMSFVIA